MFDEIVTFDDTHEKKPSPVPFNMILKRLNVEPQYSLMVGDWAERDVVGAKNIGMKTAFAKYGDTFDTKQHNADYEINDIAELVGIVKKENNLN